MSQWPCGPEVQEPELQLLFPLRPQGTPRAPGNSWGLPRGFRELQELQRAPRGSRKLQGTLVDWGSSPQPSQALKHHPKLSGNQATASSQAYAVYRVTHPPPPSTLPSDVMEGLSKAVPKDPLAQGLLMACLAQWNKSETAF